IRRLKPTEDDDFSLNQSSLISQAFDSIFGVIDVAGIIIGGFSILVGGFGIANIMFVSVKEQTKLIGIQKALGAKNYFILLQFLYESVILTLLGGLLGLLIIFIGTLIISAAFDMDFTMTTGNIITGIVISVTIGIVSGIVPAYKAARLNPVEAIAST
ncbi:MAG: ABC transporter permease, partial [Bacteroidetes bacterium]